MFFFIMFGLLHSFEALKDFPIVETIVINSELDLKNLNYPCYLKIDSHIHKKEAGGVFFCDDITSSNSAFVEMKKKFPKNRIVYQPLVEGFHSIIGIKEEEVFGKVLMFGVGGSDLVNRKIVFRTSKINRSEIKEMINSINVKEIKNYNHKEKLISLIEMISFWARYNDVKEMDLNPVILSKDGPLIVDARMEFFE